MNRVLANEENLLRYGVDSELAQRAAAHSLTLTKIRTLSIVDITGKFGMSEAEARELKKCVLRAPIDAETVDQLLSASNFVCSVCKGLKGHAFIIHHIEPYEETQDNSYKNLIVLCPSDHDLAHRSGGLTLSIGRNQLISMKMEWEAQVRDHNLERASQTIDLDALMNKGVVDNEDKRTLRYLMHYIPFTSLASHIHYLPSAFNIDFFDVVTYMDTLVLDKPHAYPFTDPLLQQVYGEYLDRYVDLYRLLNGETHGISHFGAANEAGGQFIARRNKRGFTPQESDNIDEALAEAKYEFEHAYQN